MLLNEIKNTEKLYSFCTKKNDIINMYIKQRESNLNEKKKYQITIKTSDDKKCGYIYFYVDFGDENTSDFIGLNISPKFKGNSYANLLISSYIDICRASSLYNFATNQKQKKPELIHILKKFGYTYNKRINNQNQIDILNTNNLNENTFFIPDVHLRKNIKNSKLANQNNYRFVDNIENYNILDTVYLNKIYKLTDFNKCYEKQKEVKKQFILN